jgi:hypothetical protein
MSSRSISAGLPILAPNSLGFREWKAKVTARLGAHALMHVINYSSLPSELPKEWVQDNAKVIDLFFDTVAYELVTLFSSETHTNPKTHARDALIKIENHFNHNEVVTQHDLEKGFWQTTMQPNQDVVTFYSQFSSMFSECISSGLIIPQVKACMHFLDIIIERHPTIFGPLLLEVTNNKSTLTLDSLYPTLKTLSRLCPPPVPSARLAFSASAYYCTTCKIHGHSTERCYRRDPENLIRFPPRSATPPATSVPPATLPAHGMSAATVLPTFGAYSMSATVEEETPYVATTHSIPFY